MRAVFLFLLLSATFGVRASEFDLLMGKGTSHWIHVSKVQDLNALEKFKELYERNKHLANSSSEGPFKIPPTIHFIWLGPQAFPPGSVENVRSWMAQNPDWKVKFWTDRKREPPCSSMEVCDVNSFCFLFLKDCFEESQNWGEKSDILRFEILYQEGGVYVDHDANCLKPFEKLHLAYDFYCGLEVPHPPVVGRNITSGNGIIGARAFHPVIGKVIELIGNHWKSLEEKYKGRDGYSRTQIVVERTYIMLTLALMERLSEEGNVDIVFPAAYFFAKKEIPSLYSRHFFANTWATETENLGEEFEKNTKKALSSLRKRNQTIRWIGQGAISLNLLAFAGFFVYFLRQKRRRL